MCETFSQKKKGLLYKYVEMKITLLVLQETRVWTRILKDVSWVYFFNLLRKL